MPISTQDRQTLLTLARSSVTHAVTGDPPPQAPPPSEILTAQRGCFVTLTNAGRLRGCIGTFSPHGPLAAMIPQMAIHASRDPRFTHNPITEHELPQIHVEVSVLSPLEPIDDPLSLTVGVHGIYITQGHRGGCFLPEVATDQGWDAEQFLTQCCAGKAGLAPTAWQDPATEVRVFTSEKFGEGE